MQKRPSRSLQLAALLMASANAQTITSTIPVCPTASSTTITLPTTVTLCPGPHCNGGTTGPLVTAAPNGVGQPGVHIGEYTSVGPDGDTTVLGIWETVYDALGASGLVPATYTITEPCPCEVTAHPTVVPSGFQTNVVPCSVCGPHNAVVTLTQPCPTGPYASQTPSIGQPAGPAAVAAGSPGAAVASAAATAAVGAGAEAGPGGASATASANGGAAAYADVDSPGASASASANAGAAAGVNSVPAPAAAPVNGSSVNNTPKSPVQSYVSSAAKNSFAGFTLLVGLVAVLLL